MISLKDLISFFLNPKKNTLVLDAVIKSHFNYCLLTWMFKSICLINTIHERPLITKYDDT